MAERIQAVFVLLMTGLKKKIRENRLKDCRKRRVEEKSMWVFFFRVVAIVYLVFAIVVGGVGIGADEAIVDANKKWNGDFDGMVEKRLIRALVPYSKTFYFLDGADQRGATYEALMAFEKYVNKHLKTKTLKVRVVVIPTKRDRLIPDLAAGLGDISAGNLTITQERKKSVDFSAPNFTGVDEIVVSAPGVTPLKTIDDLSGRTIHVRASSSYYQSLKNLNSKFEKENKKLLKMVLTDEFLEDEDLLEMMNAGLIPMIVIDSHKAGFWKQIFKNLNIHSNIKLKTGGEIAWAIRKNNPQLKKIINSYFKTHKKGTLFGNIMFNRYLKNSKWVQNALEKDERERFQASVDFFRKYAKQYKFNWLMIGALAYQESRIDQSKRSPAGAIGVMQILPSTAKDPKINIPEIEKLENNIHAGVKYLRFLMDRYFENEPMDALNKHLFIFASYNAGPAKIRKLRVEAKKKGLDPNVWFRNVETVAARRIGRETVQYVSNIFKYYIAYRLIEERSHSLEKNKQSEKQ